jgi:hypothetical protein
MPEFRVRLPPGPLSIDETHTKASRNLRFGLRQSDTQSAGGTIFNLRLVLSSVLFDQQYATGIHMAASRSVPCTVPPLSAIHCSRHPGSDPTVDFVV